MQTPLNPDYYLKHGFDKAYSEYGVPYADEQFCKEYPIIKFDTLHSYGEYEAIAASRFNTNHEDFRYNEFHGMDKENFNTFIAECMKRRIYDTGKTAEFGDDLLTLSFCEYTCENGRFVVVARKVAK